MSVSRRRLLMAGALGLSWTPFALASCNDGSVPVDPPVDNGTGNTGGDGGGATPPPGNTTDPGNTTGGGNTTDPGDGGNTTGGGGTPPDGGDTTPPGGGGGLPSGPRVRYDLRSAQGQAMLAVYARGVAAMMALPEGDPRSWTWWWYTHFIRNDRTMPGELNRIFGAGASDPKKLAAKVWDTCQSHNGQDENFFLPWHRMVVLAFENVIRSVTGEPNFTLPYWSYTDSGNQVIPSQFRRPGDPVWGALYRSARGAPGKNVNAGAPIQPPGVLNLDVLGSPTYAPDGADQGFCANIDGGLHGAVHVGVGDSSTGMGVVPWAANDPIFWVHHCNIDRVWASWNAGGGVNPTDPIFVATPFVFASPSGAQVNYTVGNMLSTGAAGYAYDRLEGASQAQPLALMMAAPPAGGAAMTTRSLKRSFTPQGKVVAPLPTAAPNASASAVGRLQGVVATPSITHIAQAITLGVSTTRVTLLQAATAPASVARALPATGAVLRSLRRAAPPMVGAAAPSVRAGAAPAPASTAPAAAAAAPAQTLPNPGPGQRALLVLSGLDAPSQPGVVYGVYLEAPTKAGGRERIQVGTVNFFAAMGAMGAMPGMAMRAPKQARAVSFDVTALATKLAGEGRLESAPRLSFAPLGAPNTGAAPTVQSVSFAIQ